MARAYPMELRVRVMNFVSDGGEKRETAEIFGIGEDTVHRWCRQLAESGDLNPKKRTFLPKKVDADVLRKYVADHPDHTLKEISFALGLAIQTVWKWLKRLNITYKKKR